MLRIFLFILLTTSLFAREYIAIIDFEGIGISNGTGNNNVCGAMSSPIEPDR